MGGKRCAIHEKEAAVSACRQCSKDLCKSCVMVTPAGAFCSSECSVLHREMHAHAKPVAKSGGAAGKLYLFVLFLAGAAVALHYLPMTKGQPYDLIGRYLDKASLP